MSAWKRSGLNPALCRALALHWGAEVRSNLSVDPALKGLSKEFVPQLPPVLEEQQLAANSSRWHRGRAAPLGFLCIWQGARWGPCKRRPGRRAQRSWLAGAQVAGHLLQLHGFSASLSGWPFPPLPLIFRLKENGGNWMRKLSYSVRFELSQFKTNPYVSVSFGSG